MPETPPPNRRWRTVLLIGVLIGLVVVLGDAAYSMVGSNLREVLPGQLYRSAHPGRSALATFQGRYGIRTVLSLRGVCDFERWYRDEVADADELGLSFEVVGMSAGKLPSKNAAREICEVLERSEPPLLVHCQRGIDRTGLVCALYMLLRTEATLDQARGQLSLRYLHLNAGRTRAMGRFLDLYEEWLRDQGVAHRPELVRKWLTTDYRPPQLSAEIESLASLEEDRLVVPRGQAVIVPVRVWNRSRDDLRMSPGLVGGVYLRWSLQRPDRSVVLESQPGGLRRACIAPEAGADLNVYLPPLMESGRFRLVIDLFDQAVGSFAVGGSDPLVVDLEVP